jgi:hypothetical protein
MAFDSLDRRARRRLRGQVPSASGASQDRFGATGTLPSVELTPYPRDALAKGIACGRQLAQRVATDSWRGPVDETARPYPRDLLAKRSTGRRRISAIEDNLFALGQLQNGGQA